MVLTGTDDFIYTVGPPRVARTHHGGRFVKIEGPGTDIELDPVTENFRGSSQAIRLGDDEWIAVTHEVDWSTGRRRYYHRFVTFDYGGFVTAYTEPFFIVSPTIEFVAGLVVHKDNYVISFGYEDERAFLAHIPKGQVYDRLLDAY